MVRDEHVVWKCLHRHAPVSICVHDACWNLALLLEHSPIARAPTLQKSVADFTNTASESMSWCCCRAFGSSRGATCQWNRWHQQLWPVCRVSYWCWWTPARSCRGTAGLQGLLMAVSNQHTQHWHTDHCSDKYSSPGCQQANKTWVFKHAFASEFTFCFLLLE